LTNIFVLIFESKSKAGALSSGAPFLALTTKMRLFAEVKHSSLLSKSVSYAIESFIKLFTGGLDGQGNVIKQFYFYDWTKKRR
jgi:hypothetical protein